MGDLAEVVDPGVQLAGLQVGMRRTTQAEVDNRADPTGLKKLLPARLHGAHARHEIPPRVGECDATQVADGTRMPERRAEPEAPFMADREGDAACAATEQMMARCLRSLGGDDLVAAVLVFAAVLLGVAVHAYIWMIPLVRRSLKQRRS